MGYGPIVNGKQQPITPYKGSWAWEQEQKRLGQWPIGYKPAPVSAVPKK